jgi:protein phosphatase 1L
VSFAAVFDGHGGYACADWLATNFAAYVDKYWREYGADAPEVAMTEAFLAADKKILSPKPGLFGMMGERGIGGSKCGATGAIAVLFKDKKTGNQRLLAANAGDARILLGRGGKPRQLSVDHVPDSEEERIRIEAQNPNPKQPLVRYVGGTWRVGGLLALSRAFGDAYLKGTGQFEGVAAGSDGYSSGFGVIADPDVMTIDLGASQDDKTLSKNNQNHSWLIVSSDGLFANVERGGGGGLTNEQVISTCDQMFAKGSSCFEIAEALAEGAVEAGSTDDVTVLVLRLQA